MRELFHPDALRGWMAQCHSAQRSFNRNSLVVVLRDQMHPGVGADAVLVEEDEQLGVAFKERGHCIVGVFRTF